MGLDMKVKSLLEMVAVLFQWFSFFLCTLLFFKTQLAIIIVKMKTEALNQIVLIGILGLILNAECQQLDQILSQGGNILSNIIRNVNPPDLNTIVKSAGQIINPDSSSNQRGDKNNLVPNLIEMGGQILRSNSNLVNDGIKTLQNQASSSGTNGTNFLTNIVNTISQNLNSSTPFVNQTTFSDLVNTGSTILQNNQGIVKSIQERVSNGDAQKVVESGFKFIQERVGGRK